MSNKHRNKSGNPRTTARDRELILDFQHEANEIEDVIKSCITEYHVSTRSSQVITLVNEWKALHKRITGRTVHDEEFYQTTEIGKFIGSHSVFEDLEKSL
jgi:hypothetical protein